MAKRCTRKGCVGGVIRVDRGLHYINCPDCHPAYAEIRKRQAKAAREAAKANG